MKTNWVSNIEHALIRPGSAVYELKRWPPPKNHPVTTDSRGRVLSVFADDFFDFSTYTNIGCRIRFDDRRINETNRHRYKLVVCWWIWGSRARITAITVSAYAMIIKPLFLLASSLNIDACDLARRPNTDRLLASALGPSVFDTFLMLLDELYIWRNEVGFTLLDRTFLTKLARLMPKHELQQTPYIPPRIWLYQVTRLRSCIDDFLLHKGKLEDLFAFCLDAYVKNYGSIEAACHPACLHKVGPFNADGNWVHHYVGPFSSIAKRFGVDELFTRWLRSPVNNTVDEELVGIQRFGTYLNLVQVAAVAYLMNFTAMRSMECKGVRVSSYLLEADEHFGTVSLIQANTTKTIHEVGAVWITSPSVELAVQAAASIAKLRVGVAKHDRNVYIPLDEIQDPLLYTPSYEPWSTTGEVVRKRGPNARQRFGYDQILRRFPFLFDKEQLKITEEDLHIARRITPTLDPKLFKVGSVWPLAFHQLRRTAAVNMTASGIVDTSSIQYQLKHLSREQSLYYGRGFSKLKLNQRAREEFIRTTYEMLSLQADRLGDDRYLSPYGPEGKRRILKIVEEKDSKERIKAAKAGHLSFRKTLFGICTKPGPCPYGGIDNVSRCGSCADALIDTDRENDIKALNRDVERRIDESPPSSPRRLGLEMQQSSIFSALNIIKSTRDS